MSSKLGRIVESNSTSVPWWRSDPVVTDDAKRFLKEYCKLDDQEIEPHLLHYREKAWQIRSYPFVGLWLFLKPTIKWAALDNEYDLILNRLKNNATLLDIGCGLVQDFRWLAADGAPTENLYAADLFSDFWELSYDMFRDAAKMHATFIVSDVFDDNSQLVRDLSNKVDIVVAGDFLHLFDWEHHIEASCRLVQLGRAQQGTMIIGKQVGMKTGQKILTDYGKDGVSYMHNDETFRQSWREVEKRTGTKWNVRVEMANIREDPWWSPKEDWYFMGEECVGLRFVCVRK